VCPLIAPRSASSSAAATQFCPFFKNYYFTTQPLPILASASAAGFTWTEH